MDKGGLVAPALAQFPLAARRLADAWNDALGARRRFGLAQPYRTGFAATVGFICRAFDRVPRICRGNHGRHSGSQCFVGEKHSQNRWRVASMSSLVALAQNLSESRSERCARRCKVWFSSDSLTGRSRDHLRRCTYTVPCCLGCGERHSGRCPFIGYFAVAAVCVAQLAQASSASVLLVGAVGFAVLFVSDKFVRPMLMAKGARLDFLGAFMGTVGGLQTFGLLGIFIGPVIVAVGKAMLDEWFDPLQDRSRRAGRSPSQKPPDRFRVSGCASDENRRRRLALRVRAVSHADVVSGENG